MAASHRDVGQRARGAFQLLLSVCQATRCWSFLRAACGRRPNPPRFATKARTSFRLSVIESLLADKAIDEDRWTVDGESECLVPSNPGRGPFRVALRSSAGVDRLSNAAVEVHSTACLEFARGSGLWTIVQFADEAAASRWQAPVRSALLLLADSGLGGERSRGWGRSEAPEWQPWSCRRRICPRPNKRTGCFSLYAG